MDIYDIIIAPDPVLKQQAQPVAKVDDAVRKQMDKMLATMYDAKGIGLAANQVGMLNRVLVMDLDPKSWEFGEEEDGILPIKSIYRSGKGDQPVEKHPVFMVNPEIIWSSDQHSIFEEGCLSIPDQHGVIERPAKVRVKYVGYDGKEAELEAEGLLSHCVQHEIDHLNGTLFIDYLSSLKRNMIIRKMEKLKKSLAL